MRVRPAFGNGWPFPGRGRGMGKADQVLPASADFKIASSLAPKTTALLSGDAVRL